MQIGRLRSFWLGTYGDVGKVAKLARKRERECACGSLRPLRLTKSATASGWSTIGSVYDGFVRL